MNQENNSESQVANPTKVSEKALSFAERYVGGPVFAAIFAAQAHESGMRFLSAVSRGDKLESIGWGFTAAAAGIISAGGVAVTLENAGKRLEKWATRPNPEK